MVSSYYPFTVRRIGQLASEICAPTQSKTVGCSNGNAEDKLRWYQEPWTWYLKVFLKDEVIFLVLFS
jgi:hypothetical protein